MNKVILMGRLTRDPEMSYISGQNQKSMARYTLAVDRIFKRQGEEQSADFINCVAFGRAGEFAEKYLHQGTKIVAVGHIQRKLHEQERQEGIYHGCGRGGAGMQGSLAKQGCQAGG